MVIFLELMKMLAKVLGINLVIKTEVIVLILGHNMPMHLMALYIGHRLQVVTKCSWMVILSELTPLPTIQRKEV